ncbi:MAG: type II toxin-antitoxin system RelE/ParE family toxin [Pseudomonadota bacterium]
MIKSFQHKGLQAFFETGSQAGIQPHQAPKLQRQLARLDVAKSSADMNLPGWRLHGLAGGLVGHYSVTVNGNWRMTFTFEDGDAVLVDYQDYH